MVTKHTRQQWPYEPQVMDDEAAERAYLRLLEDEDTPPVHGDSVIKFLTGLTVAVGLLLAVLMVWHLWARLA